MTRQYTNGTDECHLDGQPSWGPLNMKREMVQVGDGFGKLIKHDEGTIINEMIGRTYESSGEKVRRILGVGQKFTKNKILPKYIEVKKPKLDTISSESSDGEEEANI